MGEVTTRRAGLALLLMAVVSLAVRLHNVAGFPGLRAPDGMGHFTYIWHLASTGTIPLATQGWSFFHPPLYYAWMAGVWNLLADVEPALRLKLATAPIAAASLSHALVAWAMVRRRFQADPVLATAAAGFLLFLPVQLYTASYIGNESLHAVLCSLSLLATLRFLDAPSLSRALALGLLLGLGMLTKFTALAFVAAAFASIALHMVFRGGNRRMFACASLAGMVALSTCGWFYARNVEIYGDPFQMSRDTLDVRRVENLQSQGRRNLAEYLLFDPVVIIRPQWPRGIPITQDTAPYTGEHDAVREAVWTGLYANTFFDAVGGQVLPLVTEDEQARRSGQVLLSLALLPTALVLAGLLATLARLARRGWNDTDGPAVVFFVAALSLFAYGVWAVPMHAAVKATYLLSASSLFGYWLACGLAVVSRHAARLRPVALAGCALLALASVVVFTQGAFVCRDFVAKTWKGASSQNLAGVVAYAGGDLGGARRHFERAAAAGLHLAQENLSALARHEGRQLENLYRLRLAALLQKGTGVGAPRDRLLHDRRTQAEYANSVGVAYYELGWLGEAEDSMRRAFALDPAIPETSYDLGILHLTRALDAGQPQRARELRTQAADAFTRAARLDPGFTAARRLSSLMRNDECPGPDAGPARRCWTPERAYPVETTTGDLHACAVQRRRHIKRFRPALLDDLVERGCLPEG